MSLINKMLKDLEKRGVTPSMAFGNTKETTEPQAAESITPADVQADNEGAVSDKKQPSRIVIYSLLFLAIYLGFYGWISFNGDGAFKQVANPLQAQQYQPKAIKPLHQVEKRAPDDTAPVQTADASDVESEIKAAIEAEINQANATDEAAIEEMLNQAEAARQAAIQKALAQESANTLAKANKQPTKLETVKPEKNIVTEAVPKVAKAEPKQAAPKPKAVNKPVKVAKANTNSTSSKPKVAVKTKPKPVAKVKVSKVAKAKTPAPVVASAKPKVDTKPSTKLTSVAREATKAKASASKPSAPKIVKTVRSEHQAEAMYQKALSYVQQGRVSEAQTVLANALDIDPAHQDARQTLAALLLDNQRIKAAKEVLEDGLVVTPNHIPFRMTVARLEVELGQPNLALDTLMKGKMHALNHAEYQAFIGTLLQGQSRHAEAITYFQNALNINRGMSNVLIGMGVSYQALNRLDDAKLAYQKAQSNTRLPNNLKDFLDYRIKEVEQRISSN